MSINQVFLKLSQDIPVSRLDESLEIGSKQEKGDIGVEKVHIRFNEHFHIEVLNAKDDDFLVILTAGGLRKEIDMQTFQQLIAMNY